MSNFQKYKDKKLDGRFKILPEQYPEVRAKYKALKSSRKVAKLYGVDKRIILFIVNPEFKKRDEKKRIDNKIWLKYYDRQKNTEAIRKYRAKKRRLKIKFKN